MNKKSIIVCAVIAFVLCVSAVIGYNLVKRWHEKGLETVKLKEEGEWKYEVDRLSERIFILQDEIDTMKGLSLLDEPAETGEDAPSAIHEKHDITTFSIDEVERRIASFFMHLDQQDYFKKFSFKGNAYNEYETMVRQISSNTPLIGGETDSLYNLFMNIAHFFRVIGKDRLFLARDILINEADQMESLMNSFFLWYTHDYGREKKIAGRPDMNTSYEYASFFINTIGGRSYLLRRDSKIRLLATYYSVLIIDHANDMKANIHGIDIRPHIQALENEINNYTGLNYRRDYLNRLKELSGKYQR